MPASHIPAAGAAVDFWIVAVDGIPTDIRCNAGLALRQSKMRKAEQPRSVVALHYGPASAVTRADGYGGLSVDIVAPCIADDPSTLLAIVHG